MPQNYLIFKIFMIEKTPEKNDYGIFFLLNISEN